MPAEFSVLPTRHPIDPAVETALGVPATGRSPHDGANPTALDGGYAGDGAGVGDAPFSLWGSDGFTFGDIFDIINPLQHIPIVSTIYRAITGDDIAAAPKVAGGALFGGVIGLVVSIIDTAIEQITGQDTGEHILALFDDAEFSGEVLLADEDDGFTAAPGEVAGSDFTGGTGNVSRPAPTPGVSAAIIEMDRQTSDTLIFAAAPALPGRGNHGAVEIRRLATPRPVGQAIASTAADAAAGGIEPSRGRPVVRGAMPAAKAPRLAPASGPKKVDASAKGAPDHALKLLATLARAGVPLNDPSAAAAVPGLGKATPGGGGQSYIAVTNRALWLGSITGSGANDARERQDGNRPTADRGVAQAMGQALDRYDRSSRLGAPGPSVKGNF